MEIKVIEVKGLEHFELEVLKYIENGWDIKWESFNTYYSGGLGGGADYCFIIATNDKKPNHIVEEERIDV